MNKKSKVQSKPTQAEQTSSAITPVSSFSEGAFLARLRAGGQQADVVQPTPLATKETTAPRPDDSRVRITDWAAPKEIRPDDFSRIAVTTNDGRKGLLIVYTDPKDICTFCDRYEMVIISQPNEAPACRRYYSHQVKLPKDLRLHIAIKRLRYLAKDVTAAMERRKDGSPELAAYLNGGELARQGSNPDAFCSKFIGNLKCVAGGNKKTTEDLSIWQLDRLAEELKEVWDWKLYQKLCQKVN